VRSWRAGKIGRLRAEVNASALFARPAIAVIVGAMIKLIAAAAVALVVLGALAACGDRADSSALVQLASSDEAELGAEHDRVLADAIASGAALGQIVELAAKKYAAGLVAEGALIQGSVVEGARSDHLAVLRAGHCYRIVAVGGAGVEDMDLFLYDPEGVQTQQDPAQDRFPVLGLQAEICPPRGGAYRLQVHMYKGGGPFAARVYRTP